MEIRYKIKTAPLFEAVSVEELKRQLRIEHTDQDELLAEIIDRAVAASEANTGRVYCRSTIIAYLDEYPEEGEIEIEKGPVDAIASVKYLAPGAVVYTTVLPAKYQLDNAGLTARLRFLESFTADSDKMNTVEIEYTSGWASAGEIPKDLASAVILRASESYLNPENQAVNSGMSLKTTASDVMERNFKVQRF